MTELLSPAGNFASLRAAVQNGCNAVYLGIDKFSARAGAGNFSNEEFIEAVDYCHLRGVKVYVTLNTLIKQSEFKEAALCASFIYSHGADGVIVQDIGLAMQIIKNIPDFPVHASTQMTVHNLGGVRALEKLGFKRVVLARELSKKQISYINKNTDCELEVFAHGALCYCYSGQCLFSSIVGGRSGNRGRCAQPCRLPYELKDISGKKLKQGYLMSPKDLCLADRIGELAAAGADSLKIEGRLKRPEYVAAVTGVYASCIKDGRRPTENEKNALLNAFNRSGFTDGYFTERLGAKMMTYSNPSNAAPEKFEKGIENTYSENANLRKIPVDVRCRILKGRPIELELRYKDISVCAKGCVPDTVSDSSLDYDRAVLQISKMGQTTFYARNIDLDIDESAAVPIAQLNGLRRDACEMLKERIIVSSKREAVSFGADSEGAAKRADRVKIVVSVSTPEQALAAVKAGVSRIYAPRRAAEKIKGRGGCEIVEIIGEITDDARAQSIYFPQGCDSALSSNIADTEYKNAKKLFGDFRLNIYNSYSYRALRKAGYDFLCVSPELTLKEISLLGDDALKGSEVIAYGYLPLMLIKNCMIKSALGTCRKGESFVLSDRKNESFKISCRPDMCINTIYNSKPLYMADKLSDMKESGIKNILLLFTGESAKETEKVIKAYKDADEGKYYNIFPENRFTRGHFYRGVL